MNRRLREKEQYKIHGPFQVSTAVALILTPNPESPRTAPPRNFDCDHYQTCLNLAAAMNWRSFTCLGCCGEVRESLRWKTRLLMKHDSLAQTICNKPTLTCVPTGDDSSLDDPSFVPRIFKKRVS